MSDQQINESAVESCDVLVLDESCSPSSLTAAECEVLFRIVEAIEKMSDKVCPETDAEVVISNLMDLANGIIDRAHNLAVLAYEETEESDEVADDEEDGEGAD